MKILLKILFAQFIAVLAIFTWLAVQLVKVSAVVLNFIVVFVAFGAVYILWSGSAVQGIVGLSRFSAQSIWSANVLHRVTGANPKVQILASRQRIGII